MKEEEHVACMGVMRNACRMFVGKSKKKILKYMEELICFGRSWTEFICPRITAINGPVLPHE
jgi:hypothetical protein